MSKMKPFVLSAGCTNFKLLEYVGILFWTLLDLVVFNISFGKINDKKKGPLFRVKISSLLCGRFILIIWLLPSHYSWDKLVIELTISSPINKHFVVLILLGSKLALRFLCLFNLILLIFIIIVISNFFQNCF